MKNLDELREKITSRTAIIGVIGLGYVELPFAVEKAKVGFQVIGIEQNPVRAERVNSADNYISDVKDDDLKHVVATGNLRAITGFDCLPEIDVLVIWEVLDAANTKPFGIMPFYPGPGVSGHCIPIDPHYLER
ncbi:hypothetical protein FLW85_13925 [Cylindrospermopsis raciborskii MVCC19]|nr:hypothetical protein [Cylindrospermopsis raciborskii]NLQ06204.1 hypothetical protein [Cylindrospermopsis raciborskii MVCC19]OHY34145.1 hypothetical protein BCV64_06870 [Cylindrospermopsis raciborskii MVCC14]